MNQVKKHERLIGIAALSVTVFAFTSSIIMVDWFIRQPHVATQTHAMDIHHEPRQAVEESPPEAADDEVPSTPASLPVSSIILI